MFFIFKNIFNSDESVSIFFVLANISTFNLQLALLQFWIFILLLNGIFSQPLFLNHYIFSIGIFLLVTKCLHKCSISVFHPQNRLMTPHSSDSLNATIFYFYLKKCVNLMALLYGLGGFENGWLSAHARMHFTTVFYILLIFHSLFCGHCCGR